MSGSTCKTTVMLLRSCMLPLYKYPTKNVQINKWTGAQVTGRITKTPAEIVCSGSSVQNLYLHFNENPASDDDYDDIYNVEPSQWTIRWQNKNMWYDIASCPFERKPIESVNWVGKEPLCIKQSFQCPSSRIDFLHFLIKEWKGAVGHKSPFSVY